MRTLTNSMCALPIIPQPAKIPLQNPSPSARRNVGMALESPDNDGETESATDSDTHAPKTGSKRKKSTGTEIKHVYSFFFQVVNRLLTCYCPGSNGLEPLTHLSPRGFILGRRGSSITGGSSLLLSQA